ncbi:MAG: serine protease, partial [Pseudomonadota bacterium]
MRLEIRSALVVLLLVLGIGFAPLPVHADPGDVDAAARGVVRVVLISEEEGEVSPISHGTGFAITPTQIVTNAHVVREALL